MDNGWDASAQAWIESTGSVVSEVIGGESMSSIPSGSAALQTGGSDERWT